MSNTGLPAENSRLLNLNFLEANDKLFAKSLALGVRSDKPSLVQLPVSELLFTKFLRSLLISYFSNIDFSSS